MSDEIEKLKMHSPDLTQDNIAKIRALFPGCVTEAASEDGKLRLAVDFDQLRQELSDSIVEGPQERYHLNWPGKREALITANAPIAKTLRPAREESVDFDTTQNLFIEGDNLEALKLLQETYLGKVKMIYIDPPYNTGNDFVYDDDFAESSEGFLERSLQVDNEKNRLVANTAANGRFHSDWLSMMFARMKLARNLLKPDGFMFVSIDVLELSNLVSLGKEVFGEKALVGLISRPTGTRMGSGSRGVARELDYIVVFSRTDDVVLNGLPMTEKEMSIYDQEDERGRYLTRSLRRTGGENRREDRPSMFFAVQAPDGTNVLPIAPEGYESRWVCGKDTYAKLLADGMIEWREVTKNGAKRWQVYQKHYMSEDGRETSDLWTGISGNKKATKEVSALFGKVKVFDHPKPVELIQRTIALSTKKSEHDIVMDFFAGSATTAEAVATCNAEDGGTRKCVSIQIDEKLSDGAEARKLGFETIAEISKERIRRAGQRILEGECHPDWNKDVGFRVLKIDSSNMADVFYTPDQTSQADLLARVDNVKPDRTAEDLLFQVLLDWGVELTLPIRRETVQGKTVFFVDDTALMACFDDGISEDLVKELAGHAPLRIVFKDTGFADDQTKINVRQIFKAMSPDTEVKAI
jgi:adenine-specific DNA-methyltransferase